VATYLGQAIGWYDPGQGAGLIGAIVGAMLVRFIWHLLVPNRTVNAAFDFGERPTGWFGHWSARYGEVFARTIYLSPPFEQPQNELLAGMPHPFDEALDPVASVAEPADRDGKLPAWRLTRSPVFDLFGPVGLVIGGLAFALVCFNMAIPLLNLPPLMAPRLEQEAPSRGQRAPGQQAPSQEQKAPS
jgi:hypothetical protein